MAPSVSKGHRAKLKLALLSISRQAAPIVLGRPWPPKSTGCCKPCQPPSANWANASLKPAVVVTTPSFRLDGCISPAIFSGSMTPSHSLAHSSSTAWAVSRFASSKPGIWVTWSRLAKCSMANSMSLTGTEKLITDLLIFKRTIVLYHYLRIKKGGQAPFVIWSLAYRALTSSGTAVNRSASSP